MLRTRWNKISLHPNRGTLFYFITTIPQDSIPLRLLGRITEQLTHLIMSTIANIFKGRITCMIILAVCLIWNLAGIGSLKLKFSRKISSSQLILRSRIQRKIKLVSIPCKVLSRTRKILRASIKNFIRQKRKIWLKGISRCPSRWIC